MIGRSLVLCGAVAVLAAGEPRAVVLSNGRLELTVATRGGAMTRLALQGDSLSPFGDPAVMGHAVLGHFVCVDGFGGTSEEERAAGLPGHGEAHTLPWETVSSGREGPVNTIRFAVKLPIVQETFTRTLSLADGENVIAVDSELESWLGFDRPVNWGEHPTIGAPFLAPLTTMVDVSGRRARTRVHDDMRQNLARTLAPARDFEWPLAPTLDGGVRDIRSAPANPNAIDHTTTLVDPARRYGFVTALDTARHYLLGYVFRRAEYPWVQDWQSYPRDLKMYRGLEFATQPFDVPRRDVIGLGSLFGVPVYRWLPAKSKISSRFLMFWTKTPEGFQQVDDVRVENGTLVIEDHRAGLKITLAAAAGL